jgi:peptidoglycan/xylan/chitin deacetylase (PgdA/CDA1 family)
MYDVIPELLESELVFIRDNGYTTITFADVIAHFDNGAPLPEKPVILSFDDGWRNQYAYAFPLLKKYGMKGTFFVFTNPLMHHNARWVSWNEVREMDNAGMEIAGHTHTHPFLTKLTTDEELDKEISASKKFIEEEIGHPITVFAYPFGEKNPQVERAVARAGYKIARTIVSGVWNDPAHRFEFHGTLASDRFSDFERSVERE